MKPALLNLAARVFRADAYELLAQSSKELNEAEADALERESKRLYRVADRIEARIGRIVARGAK